MNFCEKCGNLLYPRVGKETKKLEYYCRNDKCNFFEATDEHLVFINELVKDSSTKLDVISSNLNKDPTLQRMKNVNCPGKKILPDGTETVCGNNEAVFFLAEQTSKSKSLSLVYVCCKCGHKWMD